MPVFTGGSRLNPDFPSGESLVAVFKSRNRLVVFRLNDEEYASLKVACPRKGARSISDFARSAVLRSVGMEEREEESLQRRLLNLRDAVAELEWHITRLLQLVDEADSGRERGGSTRKTAG